LAEADAHANAGRHDAALRAYAKAFYLLPPETRASDVGEFVALAAGQAAIMDYEQRGERESLELGRKVVRHFIELIEAAGPGARVASADAAKQQLAEIERSMPADVLPSVEDVEDEPEPEVEPVREQPTRSEERVGLQGMGKAGVALLVVGGLGAIVGVSLVAVGPEHFPAGDPLADHIHTLRPPGWAVMGGGVAVLVVGAVLLGVDRQQAKRRAAGKAEARVQPWLGPQGAGLGVVGRF